MTRCAKAILIGLFTLAGSTAAVADPDAGVKPAGEQRARPQLTWKDMRTPAKGPARAIGAHGAGCIAGAARLPLDGDGYHVANPARHREFGHPALVDFIRALATAAKARGFAPLVIGDLGQPRGGPAPNGHASHQTGLDVDIWYAGPQLARRATLRARERRALVPVPMTDAAATGLSEHFGPQVAALLELAASDPRVDRMFVNPVIKRGLCQAEGSHAWLRKVRPWWGHNEHFHVRLRCPADSSGCESQPALPLGDGCDSLAWWFQPEAQGERDTERKAYRARTTGRAPLPTACNAVLSAPAEE